MSPRRQRTDVPTIRQVAQHVGVSPATVSRVLNGYAHIRPDVRASVLRAIAELGYKPNRVARRLRATRSHLIGIVVTDITNPFFNTIMAGIEEAFFAQGYSVLMSNTAADTAKEVEYLDMMANEEVAGLVIAPTSENVDRVLEMAEDGLPVVVIDRRLNHADDKPIDVVLADNTDGARRAVEHLIALGHRRIGLVGGPQHLTSGRERYEGYCQAMDGAGLPIDPDWVLLGDHRYDSGFQNMLELLRVEPPITAVFISNNMMTLGALTAIHQAGRRIPDDIAVVGFDDMPWAPSLNPPLTTVSQPTVELGRAAARLLTERIANPALPLRTVLLDTALIVRQSCGAGLKERRLPT